MKILAKGNSMLPTMVDGSYYKVVKNRRIRIGDIIVYNINDYYICHRVVDIFVTKSKKYYYKTKGDNCVLNDQYAVTKNMILGKVII